MPAPSHVEYVFNELREAILSGARLPGDHLAELELARSFGVSQAPIREALARLREQKLIVSFPHRGSFVAEVTAHEARDAAELRRVLEPLAVRAVLPTLDDQGFATLARRAEDIVDAARAGSLNATYRADMAFHRQLIEWAASPTLATFWSHIEAVTRKFTVVASASVYDDLVAVAETHHGLVDILRSADVGAIERAWDKHIMRLWREGSFADLAPVADQATLLPAAAPGSESMAG